MRSGDVYSYFVEQFFEKLSLYGLFTFDWWKTHVIDSISSVAELARIYLSQPVKNNSI